MLFAASISPPLLTRKYWGDSSLSLSLSHSTAPLTLISVGRLMHARRTTWLPWLWDLCAAVRLHQWIEILKCENKKNKSKREGELPQHHRPKTEQIEEERYHDEITEKCTNERSIMIYVLKSNWTRKQSGSLSGDLLSFNNLLVRFWDECQSTR